MSSPTQRSLLFLKKRGWTVAVVEKWIPQTKQRKDLYGIIDILAIRPGKILGIQTTSGSNHSAHVNKALAEPRLRRWLLAGGRFILHSWSKRGARGCRKVWTLRTQEFTLEDLE